MRKKCKEEKEKAAAAKPVAQTSIPSSVVNQLAPEITKNDVISAPTPASDSQTPPPPIRNA